MYTVSVRPVYTSYTELGSGLGPSQSAMKIPEGIPPRNIGLSQILDMHDTYEQMGPILLCQPLIWEVKMGPSYFHVLFNFLDTTVHKAGFNNIFMNSEK